MIHVHAHPHRKKTLFLIICLTSRERVYFENFFFLIIFLTYFPTGDFTALTTSTDMNKVYLKSQIIFLCFNIPFTFSDIHV